MSVKFGVFLITVATVLWVLACYLTETITPAQGDNDDDFTADVELLEGTP